MVDMTGQVSVIIPAFRAAGFIEGAVSSALAQTVRPQVIVVDDASDDDTVSRAIEAGAGSDRLSVLRQEVNRGPSGARNLAIEHATGEWIALLDADDCMAPGRLASLVAAAERRGWDMIADDLVRVAPGEAPEAGRRHWSDTPFGEIELDLARFVLENIYDVSGHGRELGYLKPVMRRSFLIDNGLHYNEAMRLGEDYDLYARALLAGARFGLVDPEGYYATDRPGSLSKGHSANDLREMWRADRALLRAGVRCRDARAAVRQHMLLAHKKWAWVRLIEAVRARNPLQAAASFIAPPAVIGELVRRVHGHFTPGPSRDTLTSAHS